MIRGQESHPEIILGNEGSTYTSRTLRSKKDEMVMSFVVLAVTLLLCDRCET